MSVTIGMKGQVMTVVSPESTALAVGSGTLPVFATPCLCAMMEKAAWTAIAPALEEGESSVGTMLHISHQSATPVGMVVWAEAEVTAVDGRRVEFTVLARDEAGLIGEGSHERVVVQNARFLDRAARKIKGS